MDSIPTCVHFGPNNILYVSVGMVRKRKKRWEGKIHGLAAKVRKYRSLLLKKKKKKVFVASSKTVNPTINLLYK